MDFYLVVDPDQNHNTTEAADQAGADVDVKEPETVEVILDRPEPSQTEFVVRVVGCVLLLSIIPIMLGTLAYLIVSGKSMMADSHDLVMPVDIMVISAPTIARGGCAKGACSILYANTVRYTFNNQTKEERYTSSTLHFPGDNFTITISKSSGNPLRSDESELYRDGYARNTAGIVCIIIFVCCPCFSPGIIMCIMECSKHMSRSKSKSKTPMSKTSQV